MLLHEKQHANFYDMTWIQGFMCKKGNIAYACEREVDTTYWSTFCN